MECFKFACRGCNYPEEFGPCDSCPCWKECICCIHYNFIDDDYYCDFDFNDKDKDKDNR